MCWRDEQGWLYFGHRKEEGGIRRLGEFVQPGFIGRVLAEDPEVLDVNVYGVPARSAAPGESDVPRMAREAWAKAAAGRAVLYNRTERHKLAAVEWGRLAKDDPDPAARPRHALFELQSHVFGKDWRAAAAAAEKLAADQTDPRLAAEIGRGWCKVSRLAAADADLDPADREAEAEKAVGHAVECLKRARAGGVFRTPGGAEKFEADPDFAPVRGKFDPRE